MSVTEAGAAELFELHYDRLQRYLIHVTADADAASDIAQEAFVRLLEKSPAAEHAVPWLYRVATNLARDEARKQRRHQVLGQSGRALRSYADPPPAPDAAAHVHSARRTLEAALQVLNERERTALLMREEGYSYAEIAETVDSTVGNVGTMMARALRKAAACLRKLETT